MEILIAKTAGFCFGVKRAVDLAFENAGSEGTFTYGPIIHNEQVINALEEKGVSAIDSLSRKDINKIIVRSHGVDPSVYKESGDRGIELIDATCPYVKKIHRYVEKYYNDGWKVIIAGDCNHPEVKGINGWANNECIIVKNKEEISGIDSKARYLLVAQTTYKKEVVNEILQKIQDLEIEVEYINTICNATRDRQSEVQEIASKVECMLILGSKKSSNSIKLFEISRENCKNTYFVNNVDELDENMFEGVNIVGVTAGASTPSVVIDEVIEYIKGI